MSDIKEYIKGDKHVHQAGSVMIKFAQYNVPGQQGDWKRQEAQEAEEQEKEFADFAEVVEEVKATDDADKAEQDPVSEQASVHLHGNESSLSDSRQAILNQLLDLADKGDWIKDNIGEQVKAMLKTVLGQGETPLKDNEVELSATFWKLLESGRSERLRVTWQNLVGYFDDNHLLKLKTAPALNMDFFGDKIGSDNINKGRPSRDNMSSGFREILSLLDTYVPKVDKKA